MNDAKWTSRLSQNETPCYPWGFKLTNLHIRPIVPENGLFIQVPVLSHHQNWPMSIWYLNVLKQVLSCFSFIECKTFEEITCCWTNTILFFLSTEVSTSSNLQKDKIQTLKPEVRRDFYRVVRYLTSKKSSPCLEHPLQHFNTSSNIWESVGHGLQRKPRWFCGAALKLYQPWSWPLPRICPLNRLTVVCWSISQGADDLVSSLNNIPSNISLGWLSW